MEIIKYLRLPISHQVTLWFILFLESVKRFVCTDPTEVSSIIDHYPSFFERQNNIDANCLLPYATKTLMSLPLILKVMLFGPTAMMLSELKKMF
jgi:hypothetical protein